MSLPSVSVLMPVRNEARYLPAALASLARQSFRNWELVAVDDHSTDATAELLAQAAATDARIRVLRPAHSGLVPALNCGLSACRAPLVARMDADDVCHPQRLARQVAYLTAQPSVGLVACNFQHFPRRQLKLGMLAYEAWQNSLLDHGEICADLFVEAPFVHPTVMLRRELLEQVGGYRDMGWAEDYDLWLRLAAIGTRFASLPEVLFFWRDRPERATRTRAEYSAVAFRRCKLYHLRQGFLRGAEQVSLIGAGKEGRAWQRTLREEGIDVGRWIDLDPRKQGRELHGAPVLPPTAVRPGDGPYLVTIGTRGARSGVRQWAANVGLREEVDFLCVT